jgi:hypothetical protein
MPVDEGEEDGGRYERAGGGADDFADCRSARGLRGLGGGGEGREKRVHGFMLHSLT